MKLIGCRRVYTKRGQTDRRFALPAETDSDRRAAAWQRQLLEAADSEDRNKRLWAAVMKDAIMALCGRHPSSRGSSFGCGSLPATLWTEASKWVMSREQPVGSFEYVCAVLELDTEAARRDLCAIAVAFPQQTQLSAVAAAV